MNSKFVKFFTLFFIIVFISYVIAGGITVDDLKNLEKVNSELRVGNFDNLITTLDNTYPGHLSILFNGLSNDQLLKAWDKLEIKTGNSVNVAKTNLYRNSLISGVNSAAGINDGGKTLDSLIGGLVKRNSNLKDFEFVGTKNSKEISVDGDIINLKDPTGKIHKIPLKDLSGFKKISFSEMKGGAEGYAVHYIPEKGIKSAAILTSGFLKSNGNGYDVFDSVNNEMKVVGKVSFGNNPQEAVYFRGIPKSVGNEKFARGDYVFYKPGKEGDVVFEDSLGVLTGSKRDALNGDGARVGFQSENGIRGTKSLDKNGDKITDLRVDIINQNNVGVIYDGKVIGSNSDKKVEITSSGNDVRIKFPDGISNVEIINENGKIISTNNKNQEVYVDKGNPIKDVNGVVSGIFVNRQDSGASIGRVNTGPIIGSGTNVGNQGGAQIINTAWENAGNQLTPPTNQNQNQNQNTQLGIDAASAATYNAVNSVRGSALRLDAGMSQQAFEYSKVMADSNSLEHSRMGYGENIAYFSGSSSMGAEQVAQKFSTMWANSPGHYRNIVNGQYTRTGVGVYYSNGMWWGTQVFYW